MSYTAFDCTIGRGEARASRARSGLLILTKVVLHLNLALFVYLKYI